MALDLCVSRSSFLPGRGQVESLYRSGKDSDRRGYWNPRSSGGGSQEGYFEGKHESAEQETSLAQDWVRLHPLTPL